jgi:hypothetical protein
MAEGLVKRYGDTVALDGIDLAVRGLGGRGLGGRMVGAQDGQVQRGQLGGGLYS